MATETDVGIIRGIEVDWDICLLMLDVRGADLHLFGEKHMTLDALSAIFRVEPPPAPRADLVGRSVRFMRDGGQLLALDEHVPQYELHEGFMVETENGLVFEPEESVWLGPLVEFLDANVDDFDEIQLSLLRGLAVSEAFVGGGGAQPVFRLTRVS